jgi:hypothetical protein
MSSRAARNFSVIVSQSEELEKVMAKIEPASHLI